MTKISALTSVGDGLAVGDQFIIRDIDDAGTPNKSVTISGITRALQDGTVAAPALAFANDKNTGIYRPGDDQLAISTSGSGRLFITSAGLIGIGQSSPGSALDVAGEIRIYPTSGAANLRFGSGGAEKGKVAIDSSSNYTVETAGSERLRIDGSGRLLVGTSSAYEDYYGTSNNWKGIFQVARNANDAVAQFSNWNSTASASNGGAQLYLSACKSGTIGTHTGGALANGNSIGSIIFNASDGSDFRTAAWIQAAIDGTPGTADVPGRLVFSTTADGASSPTEAMRIKSTGAIQFSGALNFENVSGTIVGSGGATSWIGVRDSGSNFIFQAITNGTGIGNLLVGYSASNGAYKLQVNSQIFATSATIATSDGRYKEHVAALDGCVDLVKALRPVSFDWKTQEPITRVDENGKTVVVREAHNFPNGKQVGFIAQEVEEVLASKPWLGSVIKQNVRSAVTDADGNELAPEEEFLGIAEGNLVAVLTSALKDAIGRIESLEVKVAALKA